VVEEERDRGEHACADQGVSRDAPQRHRDVLGRVARQHWRVQGDDIHAYDCSGVRSDGEAEACDGVDEERTKRFGLHNNPCSPPRYDGPGCHAFRVPKPSQGMYRSGIV
jgi:hypothetical protein